MPTWSVTLIDGERKEVVADDYYFSDACVVFVTFFNRENEKTIIAFNQHIVAIIKQEGM